VLRIASPDDFEAVIGIAAGADPSPIDADRFRADLALASYRAEWTWLDEEEGRIRALAVWWALPGAAQPASLDLLWAASDLRDPAGVVGRLLVSAVDRFRTAGLAQVPDVHLDLPADRADLDETRAAVAWRRAACAAVGLTDWNERRQQEWTAATPVPRDSGRLTYAPGDDAAFLDAFARAAVGSLDVLTLRTVAALGPAGQAQDDLEFYLGLPGDRSLWRLAHDGDGRLVGFAVPSRTAYDASVSYLGVLPEHRGKGFVDDLLAEITRLHAEAGAERITGTTDSTNAPMLAAFARAGYTAGAVRLVGSCTPEPAAVDAR
jgi:ribosomal protein S18 acetylase RimI-like enzyme